MKDHKDKGRYTISIAILQSKLYITNSLRTLALHCVLAYKGEEL